MARPVSQSSARSKANTSACCTLAAQGTLWQPRLLCQHVPCIAGPSLQCSMKTGPWMHCTLESPHPALPLPDSLLALCSTDWIAAFV